MIDASLRANVLAQIQALRDDLGISIIYITHDLATARQVSDEVFVLNRGKTVESGTADEVISNPQHALRGCWSARFRVLIRTSLGPTFPSKRTNMSDAPLRLAFAGVSHDHINGFDAASLPNVALVGLAENSNPAIRDAYAVRAGLDPSSVPSPCSMPCWMLSGRRRLRYSVP